MNRRGRAGRSLSRAELLYQMGLQGQETGVQEQQEGAERRRRTRHRSPLLAPRPPAPTTWATRLRSTRPSPKLEKPAHKMGGEAAIFGGLFFKIWGGGLLAFHKIFQGKCNVRIDSGSGQ